MKKTIALILILIFGMASVILAVEDTWIRKADMPTARSCLSTSVVNGKIYAIGGIINANSPALSTVEEYDLVTDTWSKRTNMPTARINHGACVVEDKIYVIGGGQRVLGAGSSTVEQYDPETDTWTRKANMPTARFVLSASVLNGKIYAIGGKPGHNVSPLKTVEVYDPVTDTWTTKADMRTARYGLSTCVVNGKIYAIGGDPGNYVVLRTVEEYDPVTNTWTRKADMPTARAYLSASVLGGLIYAIGGEATLEGVGLSIVDEYDPATDSWARKTDMPTPRFFSSSSTVNGQIYVIGGAVKPCPSWQACSTVEQYDPNPLVVDFNGDGIVDSTDMCMMVDYWHTNEVLYDIAPRPFGDGIVDVQDLILLSKHLFEEIFPPDLIAYWKLNETEGDIAYNSVGNNDGLVNGNPVWQPEGGMVDAALQLDGIDDYVETDFVLNPNDGSFSVFVWVKGGAPGQVVISQVDCANWLATDAQIGALMTQLKGSGRTAKPLQSQINITDGNWHRIGLVWDGSNRTLYVDGLEVAKDTQDGLEGSDGGLYIGCGKAMEAGTYWSGLIDDVRIYNRVVKP
jgi:N-acetylneuraminic acid mutarotase